MTQTVLLGDITLYLGRGSAPSYTEDKIFYVLNQKCIRDWRVLLSGARFTDTSQKAVSPERELQVNDVLVNSTGQGTLGRVGQFHGADMPATVDSHITIVRPDPERVDPLFLGYSLKSKEKQIEAMAEGSTGQTELSRFKLAALEVKLPDVEEQKKVVDILGTIDERIDLNRRINETLEQIGRALFRYFFVDNPEAAKWKEVKLSDISSYISRGISPGYDENGTSLVINQRCIRDGRLSLLNTRRQAKDIPDQKLLRAGDVLINSTGVGTLGRVAQVDTVPENVSFDSHVTVVRPSIDACFFGQLMRNLESTFESMGSGTTGQTELSRVAVGAVKVCLPPERLIIEFGATLKPLREKMHENDQQVRTLIMLRDALLPRLISGKIKL